MKFALVDSIKAEATKGAKGICPSCGSELIAKCGEVKINHWAHKQVRNCDPWWENETEWHRSWKNHFPSEWQEISLLDEQTTERHFADVRTSHGLVIEFQHSSIAPEERIVREKFYKNMVWVVDGTRLKRDYPRFQKGRKDFLKSSKEGIYLVDYLDECFPSAWIESSVPVLFDFQGIGQICNINDVRSCLYCLFPIRSGRYGVLAKIPRNAFIKHANNGEWLVRINEFINKLSQEQKLRQQEEEKHQHQLTNLMFDRITRAMQYRNRRRRF